MKVLFYFIAAFIVVAVSWLIYFSIFILGNHFGLAHALLIGIAILGSGMYFAWARILFENEEQPTRIVAQYDNLLDDHLTQ